NWPTGAALVSIAFAWPARPGAIDGKGAGASRFCSSLSFALRSRSFFLSASLASGDPGVRPSALFRPARKPPNCGAIAPALGPEDTTGLCPLVEGFCTAGATWLGVAAPLLLSIPDQSSSWSKVHLLFFFFDSCGLPPAGAWLWISFNLLASSWA